MSIPSNFDLYSFMETNDALFDSLMLDTKLWGFLYAMRKQQSQIEMLRSQLMSMQGRLDPGKESSDKRSSESSDLRVALEDLVSKFVQHRRELEALCECDNHRRKSDVDQNKRMQSLERALGLKYTYEQKTHIVDPCGGVIPSSPAKPCDAAAPRYAAAPRSRSTEYLAVIESSWCNEPVLAPLPSSERRYLLVHRLQSSEPISQWSLPGVRINLHDASDADDRRSSQDKHQMLCNAIKLQTGLSIESSELVTSYDRRSDDTRMLVYRVECFNGPPQPELGLGVTGCGFSWSEVRDMSDRGAVAPYTLECLTKYIEARRPGA